ncbi:hypothetical protein SuNHUV7_33920 (plasmid) [Pseudoseohaeicola sp. NH-UV-7]|jgi:uncharacterized protein (TIGR00369 family)|uniref:PaaI family thioesterase n=1 Tax=unclassified Sulfitobacter TaxID=196795 RepID=UPI000E0AE23D|nr:PaaI family thioesterase [Sulfitobacter sp. JL08]AXI54709.1 thioesterase [Sulfitobacter sp. JL08]
MPVVMTKEDMEQFLNDVFPQVAGDFGVDHIGENQITMRLFANEKHLRPGGTVSGPAMFGLADVCVYMAIMAMIGPKALAVTTNASIDFMRKPVAGVDLVAQCRLLKLGRVLAVGEVLLFSEGMTDPVARASMTYSIPPKD